jgi:hypothetical protein
MQLVDRGRDRLDQDEGDLLNAGGDREREFVDRAAS